MLGDLLVSKRGVRCMLVSFDTCSPIVVLQGLERPRSLGK